MKQNKDEQIKELKSDKSQFIVFWAIFTVLALLLSIWVGSLRDDKRELNYELQSCQDNLGYYEGDLKPYGDFVNVTCRIPKEVIEKNWIYQIYVIADNKTCEVME